jgi:hypothetical protein
MFVYIGKYADNCEEKRDIQVRIDEYDTWSLDHTLALIILPALKAFKADPHCGTPGKIFDLISPPEGEDNMYSDEQYEEAQKLWIGIVDKMIFAFTAMTDEHAEDAFYRNGVDHSGLTTHHTRIDEGLELFGKYFRNLWT